MDGTRLASLMGFGLATIIGTASGSLANPISSTCNGISNDIPSDRQQTFRSARVELFYYRNAANVINILNDLPLGYLGCASELPTDDLQPGEGVGRGGGNIIILYGEKDYIDRTQRLITVLDLPLSGIRLQLWGVQISSQSPKRLAEAMVKVRGEIDLTQQLIREMFQLLQQQLAGEIEESLDPQFKTIARELGYQQIIEGSRSLSLLDLVVIGNAAQDPFSFYQDLYKKLWELKQDDRYEKYFDAAIEKGTPPFNRFFRSRGLYPIPSCIPNKIKNRKDRELCKQEMTWSWKEQQPNLVAEIAKTKRKSILEFAFQYADFVANPDSFNYRDFQYSAINLNGRIQRFSTLFQQDINDFFVQPTLREIQEKVRETKKVSFAQVGRSTVASLSGVETVINSESTSAFQVSPPARDLPALLTRAGELQSQVSNFVPRTPVTETEVATAGPIPVSQLIGLFVALTEQQTVPVTVKTGTSLTFTPGILRDANSAELNINLTVTDPNFEGTADATSQNFSRIGQQSVKTTIYTQALDFFDLSTFTSQATLDGGRFRVPVVGQVWHSIFGGIPGFGNLFSFSRGRQTVLHESLLLTNSYITPTPLAIGLLLPVNTVAALYQGNDESGWPKVCTQKLKLIEYLDAQVMSQAQGSPFERLDQKRCLRYGNPPANGVSQSGVNEVSQSGVNEVSQSGVNEVSQSGVNEVSQSGVNEVSP